MNVESSARTTATPNAISSHGRGLPDGCEDVSVAIRSRPVIGGNFDVHVDATTLDFALRQLDLLEHQEFGRRLEFVNEAPDVPILTGERDSICELDELAVALRPGVRRRALD